MGGRSDQEARAKQSDAPPWPVTYLRSVGWRLERQWKTRRRSRQVASGCAEPSRERRSSRLSGAGTKRRRACASSAITCSCHHRPSGQRTRKKNRLSERRRKFRYGYCRQKAGACRLSAPAHASCRRFSVPAGPFSFKRRTLRARRRRAQQCAPSVPLIILKTVHHIQNRSSSALIVIFRPVHHPRSSSLILGPVHFSGGVAGCPRRRGSRRQQSGSGSGEGFPLPNVWLLTD